MNPWKCVFFSSFVGGAAIGLSFICAPFVTPAFRKYCLPYVPATNNQLNNVLKLLQANSSEKLLDIGSGDGRIVIGIIWFHFFVALFAKFFFIECGNYCSQLNFGFSNIAAAKNGLQADGVELNTWLVQYSRLSALYHGVFKQTTFYQKDLWKFNVSPYKYIVIFGVEQMVCLYNSYNLFFCYRWI